MDSLIHAVLQATLISKFVLVLLLAMSIASGHTVRQMVDATRCAASCA